MKVRRTVVEDFAKAACVSLNIVLLVCAKANSATKANAYSLYVDESNGSAYLFEGDRSYYGDVYTATALLGTKGRFSLPGIYTKYNQGDTVCVTTGLHGFGYNRAALKSSYFQCGGFRFHVERCLFKYENSKGGQACGKFLISSFCEQLVDSRCIPIHKPRQRVRAARGPEIKYVYDSARGVVEILASGFHLEQRLSLTGGVGLLSSRNLNKPH